MPRLPWLHILRAHVRACGASPQIGCQLGRFAPVAAAAATGALLWPGSVARQESPAPAKTPANPTPPQPAALPAAVPAAPAAEPGKAPATPPADPKKAVQRTVNIDQEMLKSRRLFLTGEVNDDMAKIFVQQLLFLEADDPNAPVTIFINSGGGLVHSGLAILDVMANVSTPLKTVCYGRCFSIAAVLLAAGTPGHRSAYEHARLMIHEPSCSYPKLSASDVILKAEELRNTKQTLEEVLSRLTGKPLADIVDAVARDRYMSVQEGRDFGLVDSIISQSERRAGVDPGKVQQEKK